MDVRKLLAAMVACFAFAPGLVAQEPETAELPGAERRYGLLVSLPVVESFLGWIPYPQGLDAFMDERQDMGRSELITGWGGGFSYMRGINLQGRLGLGIPLASYEGERHALDLVGTGSLGWMWTIDACAELSLQWSLAKRVAGWGGLWFSTGPFGLAGWRFGVNTPQFFGLFGLNAGFGFFLSRRD